MKYLVVQSFYSTEIGAYAAGEIEEFTPEQARVLDPYITPVTKGVQYETADLYLENIETADAKPVRKGRDNAHPTRKQ